jgi:hypothetical protein
MAQANVKSAPCPECESPPLNAQGDGVTMDLLTTSEFAWIDNYFTALEAATVAAE